MLMKYLRKMLASLSDSSALPVAFLWRIQPSIIAS